MGIDSLFLLPPEQYKKIRERLAVEEEVGLQLLEIEFKTSVKDIDGSTEFMDGIYKGIELAFEYKGRVSDIQGRTISLLLSPPDEHDLLT